MEVASGGELGLCKEQVAFSENGLQGRLGESMELPGFPPDHVTERSAPEGCCLTVSQALSSQS